MDDWNMDEIYLVSDQFCNIENLQCPNVLQGMTYNVGLYWVLVTLHMWFTTSIEQDEQNQWH